MTPIARPTATPRNVKFVLSISGSEEESVREANWPRSEPGVFWRWMGEDVVVDVSSRVVRREGEGVRDLYGD